MRERFRGPVVDGRPAGVAGALAATGPAAPSVEGRARGGGARAAARRAAFAQPRERRRGDLAQGRRRQDKQRLRDRRRARRPSAAARDRRRRQPRHRHPGGAGPQSAALPTVARRSAHRHRADRNRRPAALLRVRTPERTAPARRPRRRRGHGQARPRRVRRADRPALHLLRRRAARPRHRRRGPRAQSAIGRADQVVLVTTPESVASTAVFTALQHLHQERTIVAANKFHARRAADLRELERRLRERRLPARSRSPTTTNWPPCSTPPPITSMRSNAQAASRSNASPWQSPSSSFNANADAEAGLARHSNELPSAAEG